MNIVPATVEDAAEILSLQKLAFQSQAAIYQDYGLAPLIQTIEEIADEFSSKLFLKAVGGTDIIGSVRALTDGCTCHIGRLIVHPEWQGRGIGSELMKTIEAHFSDAQRYEVFTGTKSERSLYLYSKLGYKAFREQVVSESPTLIYMEKRAGSADSNAGS